MMKNSEIRKSAWLAMGGKWGISALVTLLLMMIALCCNAFNSGESVAASLLSLILSILVMIPVKYGYKILFLGVMRDDRVPSIEALFIGFNRTNYSRVTLTMLLVGIYTFLWSLLLVVPGVIKSLSYAMTPYILAENPELGSEEAIGRSMAMMQGRKGKLFRMILGQFGLTLLSGLALGIPLFWLAPYYQSVYARFYLEAKSE